MDIFFAHCWSNRGPIPSDPTFSFRQVFRSNWRLQSHVSSVCYFNLRQSRGFQQHLMGFGHLNFSTKCSVGAFTFSVVFTATVPFVSTSGGIVLSLAFSCFSFHICHHCLLPILPSWSFFFFYIYFPSLNCPSLIMMHVNSCFFVKLLGMSCWSSLTLILSKCGIFYMKILYIVVQTKVGQ